MKACVLHGIGDLKFESVTTPTPKPGEVLVRICACGICGSDIQRVWEKGTYTFPTIPGHEFAGIVINTCDEKDRHWIGKKAAVFPLLPCMHCDACAIGEYAQCTNYNYFGSRCDGGFAEYICVPVWNLVPVPESLSCEEAAMAEPAAVALHALRRANVQIGDSVAIFGAGPIGLMLASWAKLMGAERAILIDIDQQKLDFAEKLGFIYLVNSRKEDAVEAVMRLTDGRGSDCSIEGSGASIALEQCLKCTRIFGNVVAMGNPLKEVTISQKAYWVLLRRQLNLCGTWNSTYSDLPHNDWKMALQYMSLGKLQLKPFITHRIPLEGCPDALSMMRDKSEFYNKVMIVFNNELEQ
jgi:L-iditol 2-dehydrogenase